MKEELWGYLQLLVDSTNIMIDRHKGSTHHRFPDKQYPVDYGYLESTTSIDLSGVDIWIGSMGLGKVVGLLCTVDLIRRDKELKIFSTVQIRKFIISANLLKLI